MTNSSVFGNQILGLKGSRRAQLTKMDTVAMAGDPSGPYIDNYTISSIAGSISMLGAASVDHFCGLVKTYAEANNLPELADDADDMRGPAWGMLDGECYALAVVILFIDDLTVDVISEILKGMDSFYSGAWAQMAQTESEPMMDN